MSEEKRDGAMRIFEALSAVDEELLAQSEASVTPILPFWYRHSKGLVAAVCLVVLGVSAWSATTIFSPAGAVAPRANVAADSAVQESSDMEREVAATEGAMADAEQYDQAAPEAWELRENAAEESMPETATEGIKEVAPEKKEELGETESTVDNDKKDALLGGTMSDKMNSGSGIKELTESEARAMDVVGAYVPESFPKGYVFDAARGGSLGEQHDLFVCYTSGMEDITLSLSTEAEEFLDFADVENPIYYAEDLSLELIDSRMKICEDKGDTSTPLGVFAVYYKEGGVLIKFSGRGSAEKILEMFASIRP